MKGSWNRFFKITLGMVLAPVIVGGAGLIVFINWNPFDKEISTPKNQKEKLEAQILQFRNEWTKNRSTHLSQLNKESKECAKDIENNTYDLPEPIQKIINILEEKDENPVT